MMVDGEGGAQWVRAVFSGRIDVIFVGMLIWLIPVRGESFFLLLFLGPLLSIRLEGR
jgi:hypothetical protein